MAVCGAGVASSVQVFFKKPFEDNKSKCFQGKKGFLQILSYLDFLVLVPLLKPLNVFQGPESYLRSPLFLSLVYLEPSLLTAKVKFCAETDVESN